MSGLRINWEKVNLTISIISGLLTIIAIIPILLGLYFKFPFFYNLVQLNKIKAFNTQGYVLYRPFVGKIDQPDEKHAWFVTTNTKYPDNAIESIKSLKQGDTLFYALNDPYFLRTEPILDNNQKFLKKGRPLFFIKENQCVVVLENGKDAIKARRLRPIFHYFADENGEEQTFTEDKKQEMEKALASTNKKLKEAKKENAKVKILEESVWLKVALTPCPIA